MNGRFLGLFYLLGACVLSFTNCAAPTERDRPHAPAKPKANLVVDTDKDVTTGKVYRGKASWYSVRTNGGTQTASGERLRNNARTAAHRWLKMGTRVRVTNLRNRISVIVRINDRGPFIKGRIIDVTIGVARELGMVTAGVVPVTVEVLKR